MKKILLSLAMAMTAIGASAQNTYNVRVGGAVLSDAAAFTTIAQANISLNNYGSWIFSPAVQLATEGDDKAAMIHANMGYRKRIGNNCLFVPKLGVAGGYFSLDGYNDAFLVGPSIDLALELKHVVIGVTGFYSINKTVDIESYYDDEYNIPMLSLTLGYTF
mgnify:FL=1|uniref:hypothetical protein n=1 Tax=Prevotella sp. TaxID=59823 RepID=UPI00402859A4